MKLIKFIRKPERDGANIIYIPAVAEKISQLAVVKAHVNKHGFEVPELYFLDTYGLGTIEVSKEQFDSLLVFLIMDDKGQYTIESGNTVEHHGSVLGLHEYNTDMTKYEPANVEEVKPETREEVKPQLSVVNDSEVSNDNEKKD